MSGKIVELQGLRCIAIISVLLYHIWPDFFVNGYLGVDIFFAISGYFMALILLSPTKIKSFSLFTLSFYYRRIYRILPLYLLNIFLTLITVPAFLYALEISTFISQIKSALMFSTNFSMLFENLNYFNKDVLSIQWFKHYWSLCVEIQFYAIIPFFVNFCQRFSYWRNLFVIWPLLIAISQGFSMYIIGKDGVSFAFLMLPTRIWQFSGGFCAFYVLNLNEWYTIKLVKWVQHSITTNVLTFLLLIITLFPKIPHNQAYSQILTIIISSFLIGGIGRIKDDLHESILSNRIIGFIGDASYSIYISHWAIINLFNSIYESNDANKTFLLCLCFMVGIIIHLWIEQPICKSKLKPKKFFTITFFVYFYFIFGTLTMKQSHTISTNAKNIFHNKSKFISDESEWKKISSKITPKLSTELSVYSTQIKCNYFQQSKFAESFNSRFKWDIKGTEIKGDGNLSILIIGNSHAECFFPAAKASMEGMYFEINSFIAGGTTPFEGFPYSRDAHLLKDAVKHYKPDIIFFIFKYQDDMDFPASEPIEKDNGTLAIQKMINFLTNNSKVLLISNIHFEAIGFNALKFAETMNRNGWNPDYYSFPQSDLEDRHKISSRRWKVIKCKNCIFINLLQAYCKNGFCSPVDPSGKVPLLTDDHHLSSFGTYLLTPFLRTYVEKMNDILKRINK